MSIPSPMSHTSKVPPSAASSAHQRPAPSTVFAEQENSAADELLLRCLVSPLGERHPAPELARFPLELPPRAEQGGGLRRAAFQCRRGNRQGHGDGHEDRCLLPAALRDLRPAHPPETDAPD